MKRKKIIVLALLIVISILGLVIFIKMKCNTNSQKSNYFLSNVFKENGEYIYTNEWKIEDNDFEGILTLKYDEKANTISKKNRVENNSYKDTFKNNNAINGQFIFDQNKDAILTYHNKWIPYINSEDNKFGLIETTSGFNFELEKGKKILDIFETKFVPRIQIFLDGNATEEEIEELGEYLKEIPKIVSIEYKSSQDAYDEMLEEFSDVSDVLRSSNPNIFPASYTLEIENSDALNFVEIEIKKLNNDIIYKIKRFEKSKDLESQLLGLFNVDMIIKDNNEERIYFGKLDVGEVWSNNKGEIEYLDEGYLDIYVARNSDKEIQGFIVEDENNRKSFLDIYYKKIVENYKFMNIIEKNSEYFIVCSNTDIKEEDDLQDAKYIIFDLEGNEIEKNKKEFLDLLELKQTNYFNEQSVEYVLFQ